MCKFYCLIAGCRVGHRIHVQNLIHTHAQKCPDHLLHFVSLYAGILANHVIQLNLAL